MSTDSGGNPRFKGPGMLWKTAWKGKHPYTGMPFFDHFVGQGAGPYYKSVPGGGLPGALGGFWVAVSVFIRPFQLGSPTVVPASYGDPAAPQGGWVISAAAVDATTAAISFSISDGISFTTTTINVHAFSTPDSVTPAIVVPVLAIYDAALHTITIYADFPANHNTVAFAGPYNPPPAGITTIGNDFVLTREANNLGINGLTGGSGTPIFAQVTDWFNAVKANLKTSDIPGLTDRLWAANDFIPEDVQDELAPGKINDEIVGEVLTQFGVPNTLQIIRYNVVFDY